MALPETSSKEGQNNKTTDQDDKDFDPTPEALIDEIDDERTLEEEEALNCNNGTAVQEELDDLKKESEMSIEELLAYYERMRNETQEEFNSDEEDEELDEDEEDEKDEGKESVDLDPGKVSANSDLDNKTSADSTSQKPQQQAKPNELKQSYGSDSKSSRQTPAQRHRYLPNCGIMDSDAHSTTISSNRASGIDLARQPIDSQLGRSQPSCDITDSSNTDVAPQRRNHSLTNFIIDDEPGGVFKSLLGYDIDDSDDMDEDYSYTDDENGDDERDWRRVIHVGHEFQADVPEGLCEYDDLPPYENEDKLVWNCNPNLTHEQILDYLKQASLLSKGKDVSISPASVPKITSDSTHTYREKMQDITSSTGSHPVEHKHENIITECPPENLPDVYMSQSRKRARIDYELEQENATDGINQSRLAAQNQLTNSREDNSDSTSQDVRPEPITGEYFQDEEQLLFLLLQCNYNFDEALRRRKLDPFKYYLYEPMSLWSQEECLGFEHGLRLYGKKFRSIRENKVQTRTHAEVVAFYYLWKKSERHDVYTNQYKLDRKRCLSHPGTTDYMDKFVEDNESILNASSSTTPTPPESTIELNSNVDITSDNNPSVALCHPPDTRLQSIQYILPQGSPIQRHHLQLHQPQKDDEDGQNSSVCINSSTLL